MKKTIIIGNGPNRNYVDFSHINLLIENEFQKIIKKLKKTDQKYAEKIKLCSKKINFESQNFEKSLEQLDQIIDSWCGFVMQNSFKHFEDICFDTSSLSVSEKIEYLDNENNRKNLIKFIKDIQDNPIVVSKTIFQISVLNALFEELKINKIEYSKEYIDFVSYFDNIFTLNYDNNLEKKGIKNVIHLHGRINEKFVNFRNIDKEKEINKNFKTKNKNILNELSKQKYFLSSSLIESSAKRKKDFLSIMDDVSNNLHNNNLIELKYKNNYLKLLDSDEVYLYGINIDNDEYLINFLKENNIIIFYFYRDFYEMEMAIKHDLIHLPNPKISF